MIENINSIIPLKIHQTWHTKILPPLMEKNVELLKEQNPEFEHYLYDYDDCRNFISQNFEKEVVDAFDSLIPAAYKADLWRYCVLYVHGGIYLDIKYHCVNGFKLIELTNKEYFIRDRPFRCIYNALMITLPKNENMKKCIDQIVTNVKNKYYGTNALCPTGPALLGSFYSVGEYRALELHFNIRCNEECIYKNNNSVLKVYNEYRSEQKKYQLTKYYSELWDKKYIYK
jgi:mannosyltransferase OCH1-like enzyme